MIYVPWQWILKSDKLFLFVHRWWTALLARFHFSSRWAVPVVWLFFPCWNQKCPSGWHFWWSLLWENRHKRPAEAWEQKLLMSHLSVCQTQENNLSQSCRGPQKHRNEMQPHPGRSALPIPLPLFLFLHLILCPIPWILAAFFLLSIFT